MFIRDSYAEGSCNESVGKKPKACNNVPSDAEKTAIIAGLKQQLARPIDYDSFCVDTLNARYNVRIALLHPDGMYTLNQHDIDLAKEIRKAGPGTFRSKTLSAPFVEGGVAKVLDFIEVLCSPGPKGSQIHLVLTKFKPPSPKRASPIASSMSLPNRMSHDQITKILGKITQNKEFKHEIEDILQKTYSGRTGGSTRLRYEKCTAEDLKRRASIRGIALPSNPSKATIIATMRKHN